MPNLSSREILDAKKRVEEMRRRAQQFNEEEEYQAPRAEERAAPQSRTENVMQIYDALDTILNNDKQDILLAAMLRLAGGKEEEMLLLTIFGNLLN